MFTREVKSSERTRPSFTVSEIGFFQMPLSQEIRGQETQKKIGPKKFYNLLLAVNSGFKENQDYQHAGGKQHQTSSCKNIGRIPCFLIAAA